MHYVVQHKHVFDEYPVIVRKSKEKRIQNIQCFRFALYCFSFSGSVLGPPLVTINPKYSRFPLKKLVFCVDCSQLGFY